VTLSIFKEREMPRCSAISSRRSFIAGLAASALPISAFAQMRTKIPRYPRGARVPERIKFLIRAQNEAAESLNKFLTGNADFLKTNPRVALPLPKIEAKWDGRQKGCVTPVKSQGSCGSCWAFAAVGAFEASYAITSQEWIDISEQELLDCTFGDVNCVGGGWHQAAFLHLQYVGLVDSYRYYYTGVKGQCTSDFKRDYFALNWGYVGQFDNQTPNLIPPDAALKEAIHKYGPVTSTVPQRL